ncbi:MAG: UbiA family prenyltransferase, partial [Stenotrophobium sp.]
PQNIVLGGAAGAAPPVLGWVAVTGQVDPHSLLLFLIIFVWTPPHFWALAIERHKEYAEVDIPMLPVTHGVEYTRTQVLLYTVLLVVTSILPFVFGMSGVIYLVGALALGAVFLYYALLLKFKPRPGLPMKTFGYSIVYLMGIFTLLLLDHYVRLPL